MRALLVAAGVAVAALFTPSAAATDSSSPEVRDLARRARNDPAALEQLRSIDRVDGRPADLRTALDGSPSDIAARLDTLAGDTAGEAVDTSGAAGSAREILRDRRFRGTDIPRPFAGPLQRAGRYIDRLVAKVADALNLGTSVVWAALGGLVLAGVVALTYLLARRRAVVIASRRRARARASAEDPAALEREADSAEARGDFAAAVRLRFRAGLLRLDRAGAIRYRPSMTTGAVRRRVRSGSFTGLASAFDEIVYGGRPASDDDANAARTGWPRVLEEVSSGWTP